MKTYSKLSIILLLFTLLSGMFFSCEKEDTKNPEVIYIRKTDPNKSDSLLIGAYLGEMIAIIGKDLDGLRELWFNDQKAILNPTYITSTSVIVIIPPNIPDQVTNIMKMIFSDGKSLEYPFNVYVPAPVVSSMKCEYVADGDDAVIRGDYFIDDQAIPLQVFFPGNIEAEIVSVKINEIVVKVPEGTGTGPVSVKSLYGSTRSKFYFRDDRNIILDWDVLNAAGGWRSGNLASTDAPQLTGLYVTFNGAAATGEAGDFPWNEDPFSFNLWGEKNGRPNVPFYTGDLSKAALKFEVNVLKPWKSYAIQMIFTAWDVKDQNGYITDANIPRALWRPWEETGSYQTDGWETVTIPLESFKYTHTGAKCEKSLLESQLGGLTFYAYHGGVPGQECTIHMCIDNIRIVPL